ncbi:MAG: bifunctional phosphoglucose/phosphomannose isomerase [Candidatus Omnitrophica bacterium]|nr:bifunctional phosphoglucose/phosphomannose isomerase [Candidatus Omnitrophota bacterium]
MLSLDDFDVIERYDKSGMLKLIESFPEQCSRAKEIGMAFNLPAGFRAQYKNIIFAGVGGSAIGADLVRSYITDEARIPIFVNRNYTLPGFVNEDSLVIASSYSGNTEETLSAYDDAKSKKAALFAITSGGELERRLKMDNIPHMIIPAGLPPRCALGYSFFPILALFGKIGLIEDRSKKIDVMVGLLKDLRDKKNAHNVSEKENVAKSLARSIYLKYPIIYGGQDHIDSVVTRWRGQLAENSKTISSSHILPEMNHNEIVGWENPKKLLEHFIVICLRDSDDHRRTSKRMDITKTIIEKNNVKVIEVYSIGVDLLSRIFSLIYIGDFVSFYLAILNKRDPTPVESVTYLKNELAKG